MTLINILVLEIAMSVSKDVIENRKYTRVRIEVMQCLPQRLQCTFVKRKKPPQMIKSISSEDPLRRMIKQNLKCLIVFRTYAPHN